MQEKRFSLSESIVWEGDTSIQDCHFWDCMSFRLLKQMITNLEGWKQQNLILLQLSEARSPKSVSLE